MKVDESQLAALFTRGIEGDEGAYREFYTGLTPVLRGYLRRHMSSAHGAENVEDVLQETLLAIHAKRHTHDSSVPVTAWIYAIARYKMIDFFRVLKRSEPTVSMEENPEIVDETSSLNEGPFAVREILSSLPKRFRVPIELTKIEGLSVLEASARTGISESAIKVNVHRGIKAIARMWEKGSQ